MPAKLFECAWCKHQVSATHGYNADVTTYINRTMGVSGHNSPRVNSAQLHIRICNCGWPTFFDESKKFQIPAPGFGENFKKLPTDTGALYEEMQRASSVNSHTLCVMAARKLLMHIAVEKGASTNLSFAEYVQWFVDNNYAPPNSKTWIDKIRQKGNEANHEIVIMDASQAQEIIKLCELLITFIYEYGEA